MHISERLVALGTDRPRLVTGTMAALAILLALAAALPTVWPQRFPFLAPARIDTDPENMLSKREPVRQFHNDMKAAMSLHDMVVLGVVNETHPQGVFNAESLGRIYKLTQFAKTLQWEKRVKDGDEAEAGHWDFEGVIEVDIIAPSMVDNIEQAGLGKVRFEWLMPEPPKTDEEALEVRDKAMRLPFLEGTLVSEDGKALCLYLPITSKDLSYKVYAALREKTAEFEGDDAFYITGLPVAEDTFGVEMFIQMAISAPLAMLVIFILMLLFFRKLSLIVSPLLLAFVAVVFTMGLLVVTGNTIHIMSSMIPIFIMPIAVLDSIHILSEFFDRYQETRDRRTTMHNVMRTLFMPMLYTSLTSAAGFASLALTPIPPVQVFGIFVALGVMFAWVLTMTFIPAYVMFIRQESLENFGLAAGEADSEEAQGATWIGRFLRATGRFTYARAKLILVLALITGGVAVYGISQIQINDNPIKWFHGGHPIRVADRVLNDHFAGTYMAYLALTPREQDVAPADYLPGMKERLDRHVEHAADITPEAADAAKTLKPKLDQWAGEAASVEALLDKTEAEAKQQMKAAAGSDLEYGWEELGFFVDAERQRDEVFKQPAVLEYMASLQEHMDGLDVVGKSNSVADLVKTVHRELLEGKDEAFRIPDSSRGVANCLTTYESSHRPRDLWHFITPDYRKASVWVQLQSGDNKDMERVVEEVETFVAQNPPPIPMHVEWFGLTYINVVWQDKMVSGMLQAFLGSFLVVLFMMTVLYRSALWGLLSMIPLTLTIGLIYGVIGLIGKDYDMPVAVLSSLTLGLAVDFAIHFLSRSRELRERHGDWAHTVGFVFGEPARAITRNVIVIAVGFLPLLAAPLVPYQTVGVFLAAILLVSGVGTLLLLPALMRLLEPMLFPATRLCSVTCQCGTCIVSGLTLTALAVVNVQQFFAVGVTTLTYVSAAAIPLLALSCWLMSRRQKCRTQQQQQAGEEE